MMAMRGPAFATFGTPWSHVRWQVPPMTTRSPWPSLKRIDSTTPFGAEAELPRLANRHGGNERRREVSRHLIAVPGDGVVAVAIKGDADPWQVDVVAVSDRVCHLGDDGQTRVTSRRRQLAGQPWHVDHPVVHRPASLLPIDLGDEGVEQRLVAAQPAGLVIDPGAAGQGEATNLGEASVEARLTSPEQRRLSND